MADTHHGTQIPEVAFLLKEVERKYGRKINTTTDFESLSVVIEHETGEYISSSTLKRLWGYVNLKPTPRISTLDILCRYIGYPSFADFREALKNSNANSSSFFTTPYISSSELNPGDRLVIGWMPNRLVSLQYEGDDTFTVVNTENSKLQVGDRFCATQFLLGYPLYISHVQRTDGSTPSYVAGQNGGLNRVEKE